VAKIMDYGKFKYEAAQKLKEARRNQANTILKEVRFRLKIDEHDYDTKRRHAISFLSAGDKVKAMILFRGREQSRPEQGVRLLQRFAEDVAEFGSVESTPTVDGRNMVMVIGPLRSKSDARAEQLAKRDAAKAEAKAARVESSSSPAKAPAPAAAPVEAPVVEAPVVEAPAAEAPVAEKPAKATAAKAAAPKAAAAKAPAAKKPASASADSKAADKPASEKKPAAAKAPAAKAPAAPKTTKPAAAKAAPKPSADAE
jgi:translation initiation factor IF-3